MMPVRRANWLPGIFNDFFGNEWVERQRVSSPAVNIVENNREYRVEIAAPGLTKDDFCIDIHDDDVLTVSVEKKTDTQHDADKSKSNKYLRREFSYTSFRQSLILPDDVDRENIKAKMEDGILYIDIPKIVKAEKTTVKKIAID
ncbi:MAG: Hsp20/alpha crystallin family protein [Tannerella sp.]|jgi:HSP20 family protein|nr:Hsp20/alpha crystallin family protein [Tannerella sp.]